VQAIETGKVLTSMHLKHQVQLNALRNRQQQQQKTLQEQKQKLQSLYVNEFSVPPTLLGLVIGKGGKNIKAAEKVEGVESIKVHPDKSIIVVTAKNQESFDRVRQMLEFVQKTYPILKSDIGRFVGKGYMYIKEIEEASKVVRIIVPSDEKKGANGAANAAAGPAGAGANTNGRPNRRPPQRSWSDASDESVALEVVGTPDAVNNALLLLDNRSKFLQEASLLLSGTDQARDQLRELEARFGIMKMPRPAAAQGPAGGGQRRRPNNRDANGAPSDDAAPAGDAPKADDAKAQGKPKRERRNKPKSGDQSDAANDVSAAEKKEAAEKEESANKPGPPKPAGAGAGGAGRQRPRKDRKPAGDAESLVSAAPAAQ